MYINMYELCVRTCVKILKIIKIFVQQDTRTRYRDAESQLAKSRNSYQIYLWLFSDSGKFFRLNCFKTTAYNKQ